MKRDSIDFEDAASSRRYLFSADLGAHRLGLSLPIRETAAPLTPARHTLEAALALRHAEPVLAAVEDWLGAGIVPQPFAANGDAQVDEKAVFDAHVTLWHEATDTRLYLPAEALLQAAAPPSALAKWRWGDLRCRALLDALPLQPADVEHLEEGALVLLPGSFRGDWSVRLVPSVLPAHSFAARAEITATGLRLQPLGQQLPAARTGQARVSLPRPVNVAPAALFGWNSAPPALSVPADSAVLQGAWASHAQRRASGRLMPLGTGVGLFLTRLQTPQEPVPA